MFIGLEKSSLDVDILMLDLLNINKVFSLTDLHKLYEWKNEKGRSI